MTKLIAKSCWDSTGNHYYYYIIKVEITKLFFRCTDVPGEFVWQPGVLTQAVLHGYWLLLEDLDSATQDVATVLTNLIENNFLSVPGFRENLKITSGFQLFVTLR